MYNIVGSHNKIFIANPPLNLWDPRACDLMHDSMMDLYIDLFYRDKQKMCKRMKPNISLKIKVLIVNYCMLPYVQDSIK
jgi:hypothetical protein